MLEEEPEITRARLELWNEYFAASEPLSDLGIVRRPIVPDDCGHNAHMFYLLLPRGIDRSAVLTSLNARAVNAVFHYVPLHSSPAGRRFGRAASSMAVTDDVAARLIRLPLWVGMAPDAPSTVIEECRLALHDHVGVRES